MLHFYRTAIVLFEILIKIDTLINKDSPRKGYLTLLSIEILGSIG